MTRPIIALQRASVLTRPVWRFGFFAIFLMLAGCGNPSSLNPFYTGMAPLRETDTLYGSYLAGRFAGANRDTRSAAIFYQNALKKDPENSAIQEQAFFLNVADGQMGQAAVLAGKIISQDPGNYLARMVLALDAFNEGKHDLVRLHLGKARKGPVAMLMRDLVSAWAFAAEGEIDKGLLVLDRGKTSSKLPYFYLVNRAYLNEFAGRTEATENDYVNALQQTEGRSRTLVKRYGSFLERNNRPDEAVKIYASYMAVLADDSLSQDMARAKGRRSPPQQKLDAHNEVARAIYGPAAFLAQERSIDLPIVLLQLSLFVDPSFDEARALLAELFEANGSWEDSARTFAAVNSRSELYHDAQLRLAINLDRLDRTSEAASLLRKLIAKDKSDRLALMTLGNMLRRRERFEEAVDVYSQVIALIDNPWADHWSVFYSRGVSLERTGRWAEAEKDFLRSIELAPEQPLTLNYLGYSWVDKGINQDKAMKMIQKAVALSPDDGFIVDSLGWALFKQGAFKRAVNQLERAVELQPADPTINEHLGDAYWRVGRMIEARFQWRQALALGPEDEMIPWLEQKIGEGLDRAKAGDAT